LQKHIKTRVLNLYYLFSGKLPKTRSAPSRHMDYCDR
jgi:hypothetical protein